MRERVATALGIAPGQVGIKATTNERLGFVGREDGLCALATATIFLEPRS
jgi:2C-methyl-D-erythritol 2,4-cyclodiphosphate synthase